MMMAQGIISWDSSVFNPNPNPNPNPTRTPDQIAIFKPLQISSTLALLLRIHFSIGTSDAIVMRQGYGISIMGYGLWIMSYGSGIRIFFSRCSYSNADLHSHSLTFIPIHSHSFPFIPIH